jgi:hypothetical protein
VSVHVPRLLDISLPSYYRWKEGDIVGCFIDIDQESLVFSLNGAQLKPFNQVFQHTESDAAFFPAASFMSFQQCEFNFGWRPYRFPPADKIFQSFNAASSLSREERKILPRPIKLANLNRLSVKENACTLCFDNPASIKFLPCGHKGFCETCSTQLEVCPMCRSAIETVEKMVSSPTKESSANSFNRGISVTDSGEPLPSLNIENTEPSPNRGTFQQSSDNRLGQSS